MSTSVSKRLCYAFAPMLMVLVIFTLGFTPSLSQSESYYYYNDNPVNLSVSTDWVVASTANLPGLQTDLSRSNIPLNEGVDLLRLELEFRNDIVLVPIIAASEAESLNAVSAMRGANSPTVNWVNPVYVHGDTLLFTDGEIIVAYPDGMSVTDIDALNTEFGITRSRHIADTTYVASIPQGVDALSVSRRIHESGRVTYAEPNFYQLQQTSGMEPNGDTFNRNDPSDTFYDTQWYLHNDGSYGGLSDADIDAPEAWAIQEGSAQITIATLSTGVDMGHPDLRDKIVSPYDAIADDLDPTPALHPRNAAGTAAAGIAAASTDNQLGIAGVCHQCRIMPVRMLLVQNNGFTFARTDLTARGIRWSVEAGADVMLVDWSGVPSTLIAVELITAANSGRSGRGMVIATGVGNNYAQPVRFPATLSTISPGIIAVGSSNWCDGIKRPVRNACEDSVIYGSNWGRQVNVVAPGHTLSATDIRGSFGFGSGDYVPGIFGSGGAATIVSGVAALMLSENPNLSSSLVRDIIEITADDIGDPGLDIASGWGRINAFEAVNFVQAEGTFTPSDVAVAENQGRPVVSWTANDLADWFQVVVQTTDFFPYRATFSKWFSRGDICTGASCEVVVELPGGNYQVYVRAYSNRLNALSRWGGPVGFSIPRTPPASVDGSTMEFVQNEQRDVELTWRSPENATYYDIWVGRVSSPVRTIFFARVVDSDLDCETVGTCLLRLDLDLFQPGTYEWYVRAIGPGGFAGWTKGPDIPVVATAPVAVDVETMSVERHETGVTFGWTPSEQATWYEIWVGLDGDEPRALHSQWYEGTALRCDDGRCELTVDNMLLPATGVMWYVRSWGEGGFSTGGIDGWSRGPLPSS